MTCNACSFQGAPPPAVSAGLRAAGAMLRGLDVRRRQLSDAQRAVVLRADTRRLRYLVVWLVISVLYGGCAGCGGMMIELGDRGTKMVGSLLAVPFVLMLLAGALCLVWLSRSNRTFRLACAAIPPAAPGEPACCRVCGAPVVVPGGAAFARCGYCAADNLVEAGALELVRGRQMVTFDAYEAHVRSRAQDADLVATASTTLVIAASFVVPPLAFVLWSLGVDQWQAHQTQPDETIDYVIVDDGAGVSCVGTLEKEWGGDGWWIRRAARDGGLMTVPSRDGFVHVRASDLVGKRLRRRTCEDAAAFDLEGEVVAVRASMNGNAVTLRRHDGSTIDADLASECAFCLASP